MVAPVPATGSRYRSYVTARRGARSGGGAAVAGVGAAVIARGGGAVMSEGCCVVGRTSVRWRALVSVVRPMGSRWKWVGSRDVNGPCPVRVDAWKTGHGPSKLIMAV